MCEFPEMPDVVSSTSLSEFSIWFAVKMDAVHSLAFSSQIYGWLKWDIIK